MIYKRGRGNNKWYWMDATVDGIRYRIPLKTKNWQEAKKREKERITDAAEGRLSQKCDNFARLGFSDAADKFLEGRKIELCESSYKKEKQLLVRPKRHFGSLPLRRVETHHLLAYRDQRASDVGPVIVNMEMGVIGRILRKAKRWNLVAADIKPLRNRGEEVGRAMESSAKAKLLKIAGSRPEWVATRCATILALNTTMRGCEIRNLRLKNINLIGRWIRIDRSKTEKGKRTIPLNAAAFDAAIEMYRRAQELGATEPDHYLFPSCEREC